MKKNWEKFFLVEQLPEEKPNIKYQKRKEREQKNKC